MTSPVSIGDALLLCKIAFKLGQAFTSGRKSAPAEFREVENQLYSLSAALSALHGSRITEQSNTALGAGVERTPPFGDGQVGGNVLHTMLHNCRETLSHLESIVQRYAKLKNGADPEASVFKKWSKKLAADIKKIKWTAEGGDLVTLRSQLMVHINSINVVLGVANNVQIDRVGDTLADAMNLLREIREYVSQGPCNIVMDRSAAQIIKTPPLTRSFFELYSSTSTGQDLLCGHALLDLDWDKTNRSPAQGDSEQVTRLFTCQCTPESSLPPPHMTRLSAFGLTPLSFATRLANKDLSWMLCMVADRDTGAQVSLVIKKLSPTYMLDFDELFIQRLSTVRARFWLSRGMGTTLAFVAANAAGEPEAHVLNLLGDVSSNLPFVEEVQFSSTGRPYSRSDIDDIQIAHYFASKLETFLAGTKMKPLAQPQDFAEIVIYYGGNKSTGGMDLDVDIVKTTLRLKWDTRIEYSHEDATVGFLDIRCTSTGADGEASDLANGRAMITFSTQSAAQNFKNTVDQMRAELAIFALRLPRSNEVVVVKLQAGGVHTEEVAMAEADITIVRNVTDESFRLILTSHDQRTVVSQKLAPDFTSNGTNFRSPTWIVHLHEDGRVRNRKCPDGFSHLVLSDVYTNKLFDEWVRSQLWSKSLLPVGSSAMLNEGI